MSHKKGILSHGSSQQAHVKIIAEEKKRDPAAVAPPPPPASVTAPVVSNSAKDEIELLREGVKNVHGEQVKRS